jgi:hypothetical protein
MRQCPRCGYYAGPDAQSCPRCKGSMVAGPPPQQAPPLGAPQQMPPLGAPQQAPPSIPYQAPPGIPQAHRMPAPPYVQAPRLPGPLPPTPPPLQHPQPYMPPQPPAYSHLRPCGLCRQPISSAAGACPHCGHPNPGTASRAASPHPTAIAAYICAAIGLCILPIIFCPIGIGLGAIAMSTGDRTHGLWSIIACGISLVLGIIAGVVLASMIGLSF